MYYETTSEYVLAVLKAMDKEKAEEMVLEVLTEDDSFMDELAEIAEELGLQWDDEE